MSDAAASPLPVVRTVADLRETVAAWRAEGARVGFVPTMGALHEGHLSLLDIARDNADRCVASVFVNPTQFGPNEDFDAYPRTEADDAAMLAARGCDLLYAPDAAEMYPDGFKTEVRVGGLTDMLCGASRPGHFNGVTTVVAKLLNQAGTDFAVFGEKDFQQLQVIRRMVADLDIPVRILFGPTVREADGLALSSRNRRLSPEQRNVAGVLNRVLSATADALAAGAPIKPTLQAGHDVLLEAGFARVDYFEARMEDDLIPLDQGAPGQPARLLAAAHLGDVRLIDNWAFARG